LEYEKVKKIAPENNPVLVSITNQIQKIKPSILENIASQRKSLIAGKNILTTNNNKYSAVLSSLPRKQRELLEINRQQSIKSEIYTFLLQKQQEAAMSYASTVANNRLVDSAMASTDPVSPNRLVVYCIALLLALAAGIGIVELKELFVSNIVSQAEIEKYTSIPIIGELVLSNSKNPIVVSHSNSLFIAEEFRQLRTALGYLGINAHRKKILITSSIAAEGKSFVAVNLAISLALTLKKVVLVDLDLRMPSLTSLLDFSGADGISQYLSGESEIEATIKRTELSKNLFFIPSGAIASNPSELLLNGRINQLFTYLEESFDYIVIDTSPVNPVTDASILSPFCDTTLYVVRQGVTPKMFIQKLEKYNKIKSLKNMAIVLNGAKGKGLKKYDRYFYGYKYVENKKTRLQKTI